jgi:hypothetical protein
VTKEKGLDEIKIGRALNVKFQGFSLMNTKGFLRRTKEDTRRNGVLTGSLTDIEMG